MVLIGTIMAATLFGYSIGMIVGLKAHVRCSRVRREEPVDQRVVLRSRRGLPALGETKTWDVREALSAYAHSRSYRPDP